VKPIDDDENANANNDESEAINTHETDAEHEETKDGRLREREGPQVSTTQLNHHVTEVSKGRNGVDPPSNAHDERGKCPGE